MAKMLSILANSLRLTFQELRVNKTRTALSLTGVAFGIFCIIGVLATVNSLEHNIQNEVSSLGNNTIYIDKWDYSGGPDKPWWKMKARPVMKYEEQDMIKERSVLTENITFLMQTGGNLDLTDVEPMNTYFKKNYDIDTWNNLTHLYIDKLPQTPFPPAFDKLKNIKIISLLKPLGDLKSAQSNMLTWEGKNLVREDIKKAHEVQKIRAEQRHAARLSRQAVVGYTRPL